MSYDYRLNDRLNSAYIDVLNEKAARGDSANLKRGEFIHAVLNKGLTPLDKFFVFLNPGRDIVNFKFDDHTISALTGNLRGKSAKLIKKVCDTAEESLNRGVIEEAQRLFSTPESVLQFIEDNEAVLDIAAMDEEFLNALQSKLKSLSSIEEAREKTLKPAGQFFQKVETLFRGNVWGLQSEWAKKLSATIQEKISGDLSNDDIKKWMKKPDVLKYHEDYRINVNIASKVQDITDEVLEAHSESPELKELGNMAHAIWEGIFQQNGLDQPEGTKKHQKAIQGFNDLINIIFNFPELRMTYNHISVEAMKNLQRSLLKEVMEHTTFEEVKYFIKGLMIVNRVPRYTSRGEEYDRKAIECDRRLLECLKAIPKKEYLRRLVIENARELRDDESFQMALLLFVESVKNDDLEGILIAQDALNHHGEYDQLFLSKKQAAAALVKSTLTPEELEIFEKNSSNADLYKNVPKTDKLTDFLASLHEEEGIAGVLNKEEEKSVVSVDENQATNEEQKIEEAPPSHHPISDDQLYDMISELGDWEVTEELLNFNKSQETELEKELKARLLALSPPPIPNDKLEKNTIIDKEEEKNKKTKNTD